MTGLADSNPSSGDKGVNRPIQTALVDTDERPVGPMPGSVWFGDNAGLIASLAPLYLTGSVLDVTYGRGTWWQRFTPVEFGFHDLASDGVDFRALPETDNSWDTVCFDPPYIRTGGFDTSTRQAAFRDLYGLDVKRTVAEVEGLTADGLAECARVASRWVLAKCCDWVDSHALLLGHVAAITAGQALGLRVHDLIVHARQQGPTNRHLRTVRRTRRAHSYLIVFEANRD